MKFLQRPREEPDLNMTPLIDVVFLLLIFFMVSTTFQRESELSVELPEATAEPAQADQKAIDITIDAQGRYYVNGQEVINTQPATLKRALEQAVKDQTNPPVTLSADGRTPHQAVITAMDVARQLGLVHLTFATTQSSEGN